jgi:alanine dehydrogenase
MKIGCPKEIKNNENRVGLLPDAVSLLVKDGHEVFVEKGCGSGIGVKDEGYQASGATLLDSIEILYGEADLIVKVKEPQPKELPLIEARHILFTYLHLAPENELTEALLKSGCTAVAYETVMNEKGQLPLLSPMSKIAGSLATQVGAHFLEKPSGGRGILLGGVDGVQPAKVTVLGGGIVGGEAIRIALGMGADVNLIDISESALKFQGDRFGQRLKLVNSSEKDVSEVIAQSDLMIGAVLVPGAEAPRVVSKEWVGTMKEGSVVVDVAIDQGGCIETSEVTNHDRPVVNKMGVLHYGVPNIPSLVALTASQALSQATSPYVRELAQQGFKACINKSEAIKAGVNIMNGQLTNKAVARAQSRDFIKL